MDQVFFPSHHTKLNRIDCEHFINQSFYAFTNESTTIFETDVLMADPEIDLASLYFIYITFFKRLRRLLCLVYGHYV